MTRLWVEVAFALPEEQFLEAVRVPDGATVQDAIDMAALFSRFPAENFAGMPVGVWGRIVERGQRVRDGDRIELYRPLQRDPKAARRALAHEGKTMADGPGKESQMSGASS